jgi:hypothetical protein
MCYWIASSGRAAFEDASVYREQKSVARILSKGVFNFWRSAETLRATSGEIPKALQVEKPKGLEEMKLAGIKAEEEMVLKINITLMIYLFVFVCSDGSSTG